MALVGIELETLVSEPDALTTRPPPCARLVKNSVIHIRVNLLAHSIGLIVKHDSFVISKEQSKIAASCLY